MNVCCKLYGQVVSLKTVCFTRNRVANATTNEFNEFLKRMC